MSPLTVVLDTIAHAILGDESAAPVLTGPVRLRPHQAEALCRVRRAIAEFGGALLADEPGLGKTFVALALAREYAAPVVAAPAALRSMWREAAGTAGVSITFVSLEALSRHDLDLRGDLVIVDEAHHAHTPHAARYSRLAKLAAGSAVLLLTATPVRNRHAELSAMLALFLGPRAGSLDDAALGRLIVRRTASITAMPAIVGPHWHAAPRTPDLSLALRALPPALSAFDGRDARALVAMTLARCWASSLACLDAALRRRLQRGAALGAALDAGRLPTRAELRAWVLGDDAVQLAFPSIAAASTVDAPAMRAVLRVHLEAVAAMRERIAPFVAHDSDRRASFLRTVRERHPGERIIAFTAHAATAEALYRALHRAPHGGRGIALLTARGARTAGGLRPRADVIRALSSARAAGRSGADEISLVVATDLLSEGVNLQGASVVVHLDVPWTPAGLEQRVGRAARMASPHERVKVHGIAPPRRAEQLLALGRRLAHKHQARTEAVRAASDDERLRALVRPWRSGQRAFSGQQVATAHGSIAGFVAVVARGAGHQVVCGTPRRNGRWHFSERPRDLATIVGAVRLEPARTATSDVATARRAVNRWLAACTVHDRCGFAAARPSAPRRKVLARLDSLLGHTPPHARAGLSARIERARSLVAACIGAGAELQLARLASSAEPSDAKWLVCLDALCDAVRATPRHRLHHRPAEVVSLLILRGPKHRATAPAPARPPSASPGTAATR